MVIDSADDASVFDYSASNSRKSALPTLDPSVWTALSQSSTGSILITSRSREVACFLTGSESSILEVGPMTSHDAFALLQNKFTYTLQCGEADSLIDALDHMPLALTQAAAFINRTPRMTIKKYLENIKDQSHLLETNIVDIRRDAHASNSIMATWQISFSYIRDRSEPAARLLSLMSFFDRQGIPKSLLEGTYTDDEHQTSSFDHDMYMLTSFCLVKASPDGASFEMHGLVQVAMKRWLELNDELLYWGQTFVELMAWNFPQGRYETLSICESLWPHAEAARNTIPKEVEFLDSWAFLCFQMSWYMNYRGNYNKAHELMRDSWNIRRIFWGEDGPSTLDSLNGIAMILTKMDRHDEARQCFQEALEAKLRTQGANSYDTLVGMNNLASVYNDEHKWAEAEELLIQALEISKTTQNRKAEEHVMFTLANTYLYQGRLPEAASLNIQLLETCEKRLGPGHPHTLVTKANLAHIYRDQGQLNEAEQLQLEVLKISEADPGLELNILPTKTRLAMTYLAQGRIDEATELQLQVVEASKEKLGPDHFETMEHKSQLGAMYFAQHRYKEAEELAAERLEHCIANLGHNHVSTLHSKKELSTVYRSQDILDKAEKYDKEVLEAYTEKFGDEHLKTLQAKLCLADTYAKQGRLEEAVKIQEHVVEKQSQILGPRHLKTLLEMDSLAVKYKQQGRIREAIKKLEETLAGYEEVLGMENKNSVQRRARLERWRNLEVKD